MERRFRWITEICLCFFLPFSIESMLKLVVSKVQRRATWVNKEMTALGVFKATYHIGVGEKVSKNEQHKHLLKSSDKKVRLVITLFDEGRQIGVHVS